jgi:hypothetical protein
MRPAVQHEPVVGKPLLYRAKAVMRARELP